MYGGFGDRRAYLPKVKRVIRATLPVSWDSSSFTPEFEKRTVVKTNTRAYYNILNQ